MRVLLLSAYDAASHRRWHETLRNGLDDWQWTVLALPPRHFAWRTRGNPLSWSREPALRESYDLILATSMVDLATLRGLIPGLAVTPSALYFHENQFAYPEGRNPHGLLEAQMVSLYSALAADKLLFNSAYNRDSFLAGCKSLLARFPDAVPPGIVDMLSAKAAVLPVPVDAGAQQMPQQPVSGPLELVWNHRWEYDKGPGLLRDIVAGLVERGAAFRMNVVGQQFREQPAEFAGIGELLSRADAEGVWGFVEDLVDYRRLLARSDVVLSTALHDFQGLSVLEACRLGASPLVPDDLVYPEWFDAGFRYADAGQAVEKILDLAALKDAGDSLPKADVDAFTPALLLPRYRALLEALAA